MQKLANTRSLLGAMILMLSPCFAGAESEEVAEAHPEHPRNSITLGIYSTRERNGERAQTLSVSYNYHFADQFSTGPLVEYAKDPLDLWIVGLPLRYHPGAGWVLTAMPAVEYHNSHAEPLFRLGIGYDFELEGGFLLAPEINLDWVDDKTDLVVGLSFGFRY
jgi:hypothetical protein